jgi:hypothetical protein
MQWQRKPTASMESTVSEGGYVTSAVNASTRRGYFATAGLSSNAVSSSGGAGAGGGGLTMSVDHEDVHDGSYTNMALAAESRRASTKSRSYENVGGTSTAAGAGCVVMAASPIGSLQPISGPRFTKQASLPITITTVGRTSVGGAPCNDYMSTHESDVDMRHYNMPNT